MKKIWSALILLFVLLAAAGIAAAEERLLPGEPKTANITIPGDVAVFEFTPTENGYYFFQSEADENEWYPRFLEAYLLDEDKQPITMTYYEEEHFLIKRHLTAGNTYYLGVAFEENITGQVPVRVDRIATLYAEAKESLVYIQAGNCATLEVEAYSPNGGLSYQWYDGDTMIPGATSSKYSTDPLAQPKTYKCTITDVANETIDIPVVVRIETGLRGRISGNTQVKYNGSTTLTAAVTAKYGTDEISYEWHEQYSDENDEWHNNVLGTGENITLTNITRCKQIQCLITDVYGETRDFYAYIDIPSRFDVNPVGGTEQAVSSGDSVTFAVSGVSDYPISYQWYKMVTGEYGDEREKIEGSADATLTLTNVNSTGRYLCKVMNSIGKDTYIHFRVEVRNSFSASPSGNTEITVNPGDQATLAVNAQSFGTLNYQWYVYKQAFERYIPVPEATNATLTGILPSGLYYCQISDSLGNKATIDFELTVENNFSITQVSDDNICQAPGTPATLGVNVTGSGTMIYRWYQYIDGYSEIIEGARTETLDITVNKGGMYECAVTDPYGNTDSAWFRVRVENSFSVTAPEQRTYTVLPGSEVTLSVTGDCANGAITYRWTHNGEIVQETTAASQGPTQSSLIIESVNADNYGDYYVNVFDEYGNGYGYGFYISVDNHFTAAFENRSIDVEPGEDATLRINANCEAGVSTLTYDWYEQSWIIQGYSYSWDWMPDENQGTLIIPNAQTKEYRCIVRDQYGAFIELYCDVRVNNELYACAKDDEDSITIEAGEMATLEVEADCENGALTYKWYRQVDDDEDELISGATEQTYTTGPITRYDEYYCRVSDEYGNTENVWFFVSIENHLTAYAKDDQNDIQAALGETVTLEVEADCENGTLTYKWYRQVDDDEDELISGAAEQTYTTGPITRSDDYYCCVSDEYGNAENVWFYVSVDNEFSVLPVGSRTKRVGPGEDTELAVTATCRTGELSYQWYETGWYDAANNCWEFNRTVIENECSNTLIIEDISGMRQYSCSVTDAYGNTNSIDYIVCVDNELTATTAEYEDMLPVGERATIQVIANCKTGGLTYQWYRCIYHYEDWGTYTTEELIDGATNAVYITDPITGPKDRYLCRVMDEYGNSISCEMEVYADSELTAEADGRNVFSVTEEQITLAVNASCLFPDNITYNWYDNNDNYLETIGENTWTLTDPATGTYRCEVGDGHRYRFVWFYIVDGDEPFAQASGEDYLYTDPGKQGVLRVAAWNAENDITYQWYEDENTLIEGASEASYTFVADVPKSLYCHVVGTDVDTNIWFWVHINSGFTCSTDGMSRIHIIPAGGSDELTVNISANENENLTYRWQKNWTDIEGASGNSLTVTEGGIYSFLVRDQYGNEESFEFYCFESEATTINEGIRVTGPENGGDALYQFIPAKTGTYQIDTDYGLNIYRPDDWDNSMYANPEANTIRLEAGQVYYVILNSPDDSFRFALEREQQTEYTITLQKGQTLGIPGLYIHNEWLSFDYAVSSNRQVIRVEGSTMELLADGSADVTAVYENDIQTIFHITVENGTILTLPDGLERIEADAFNGDAKVKTVRIGANVNYVERGAFTNAGDICVIVDGDPSFESGVFSNSNPVLITYSWSNAVWYCINNDIPFFCIEY